MPLAFRLLMIVECSALACAVASASELPSPSAAPANVWAGPWAGVYGGGAFADPSGGFSLSGPPQDAPPPVVAALNAAGSNAIAASGPFFGLQGGWNWQFNSNFVLGVEGDLGRYDLEGSHAGGGPIPVFGIPFTINQSVGVDWEGALRVRAGYAVNNYALAFVEAGPALGDVHYSSYFWDSGNETENKSLRAVEVGLSVGAGVEFAVAKNLSVRAEYLFSRFPSISGTGTSLLSDGNTAYVAHSSGAINQNALRIGLSYYLH